MKYQRRLSSFHFYPGVWGFDSQNALHVKEETNATCGSTQYRNLLLKQYTWGDEIRDCDENPNFQLKFQAHSINIRLTRAQNSPR